MEYHNFKIRVNGQKIDEKLACGGEEFEEFNWQYLTNRFWFNNLIWVILDNAVNLFNIF